MSPHQLKKISEFREFAIDRLICHVHELNSKYKNQPPADPELITTAYDDHRKKFEREMTERKYSLITEDDEALTEELGRLKIHYLSLLTHTEYTNRSFTGRD